VLPIGRSLFRFQMASLEFFIDIILPIALWPWESTQPLTEMSTRIISLGYNQLVLKADSSTTILGHCHAIWEPKLPGTLWAPRACNGTDLPLLNVILDRSVTLRVGVHAPTKSVLVPAAMSVVLMLYVSLWPGSTWGRHDKVIGTTTDMSAWCRRPPR